MTEKIYKYEIPIQDIMAFQVQGLKQVLSVCEQFEQLVIYCQVDEVGMYKTVEVYIVGTGNEFNIPEGATFLDTVKMSGGALMWHVFYKVLS